MLRLFLVIGEIRNTGFIRDVSILGILGESLTDCQSRISD
jgi:hypothetical protein